MNFLPIALRELRARARHWTTYRNRFLAALITVLIAAFMLVITGAFGTPSIVGGTLFKTLSTIAFLFCLLEGLRHTVDCLSEEKREGTLGLIFLTELNGLDVILGKLIVNSLHSFYGLLAIFPALAIPFVLGGVVVGEFWRMMLALLNALFFALAIGLFVSSLGRDERRVWGTAIALVALVVVGLPLMDLALAAGNPSRFQPLFSLASPWCAWWCAYDSIFTAHPGTYWSSFSSCIC